MMVLQHLTLILKLFTIRGFRKSCYGIGRGRKSQSLYWEPHVIADERPEIIAAVGSELERLKSHLGASAVQWHA